MDTSALESAYRRLLAVARGGAFRPPAERDGWPAELVLAHIIATNRLLTVTTAVLLDGGEPAYDNHAAVVEAHLHEIARAAGDTGGLVETTRTSGLELVMLARRLDDATAATAVPTRIRAAGQVRMDTPMPWSGVLNTYAEVDLPERAAELESRVT